MNKGNMEIKAKLEEWHRTKSIALASEICEELWEQQEETGKEEA